MDCATIRSKFLEFFEQRDHRVVRSSALVPANDPTLYFTNAGMVQFKDLFTGERQAEYRRACSSQKCLRVSGKHNDLETVGRTPKHHTFFEMLGNFSFGDYFKREAIAFAWKFLTEVVRLDSDRMVATVFCGERGVPADDEAFEIWREEVGLPAERVFRLGESDNFWAMGETGPCGPCSEIHLLADPSVSMAEGLEAGGPAVDDRWVEVWNLVFMQYERRSGGELRELERTGVDTGMGLERLAMLVNGLGSTYETDVLRPLIDRCAELAQKQYGDSDADDVSLRVIADHARATAFCIADGVFPDNSGRQYVLRRIMRRAIRHGKLLGFEEPFFHEICGEVCKVMGDAYPELVERAELIDKLVTLEESAFRRTLTRGLKKLHRAIEQASGEGEQSLTPAVVGDLYATDGFPVDLTALIAEESQLAVDQQAALEWVEQTHGGGESKIGDAAVAGVYKKLADELGPTEFVGYTEEHADSSIVALLRDGQPVDAVHRGEQVELIAERTPFYGRGGGQVGDTGEIVSSSGRIAVRDTVKPQGALFVHQGEVVDGTLRVGQAASLTIDRERRARIRLNHSATHLLHRALRLVLGPHVAQKGSEVAPKHLRFDFSHFEAMTSEQLVRVEQLINEQIRANEPTVTEIKPFDEARRTGAMALFGEKYGDRVRVVRIGGESLELCGGTHVKASGDIGLCRIVSEEALALGVRRIVAFTGEAALEHDQQLEQQLRTAAQVLRVGAEQVAPRVEQLTAQVKQQERHIADLKRKLATGGTTDLMSRVQEVDGIKLLATRVEGGDPRTLREAGDQLRDKLGSGLVVLGGEHEGKATLLVMVSKDLTAKLHAGKLIKQLAQVIGGRGGGRPDMAQAGGPQVDRLDEALAQVPALIG